MSAARPRRASRSTSRTRQWCSTPSTTSRSRRACSHRARRSSRPAGHVRVRRAVPPGHKVALRAVAPGRTGASLRAGDRIRDRRHPPRRPRPRHNLGSARAASSGLRGGRRLRAGRVRAGRGAPHVHGLPAERRSRRNSQLRRHSRFGQLLVVGDASHRRGDPVERHVGPLPECRRRDPFATKGGCGAHYGSSDLAGCSERSPASSIIPTSAGTCILSSRVRGQSARRSDRIDRARRNGTGPLVLTIQQDGGFARRSRRESRPSSKSCRSPTQRRREPVPASELVVALQCGGSDGWSGVTANPALGRGGRLDRAPGRHGRSRRDDRDLRRRASADPPRRSREVGAEAGRPDPLVGMVHGDLRRLDRQQPLARATRPAA